MKQQFGIWHFDVKDVVVVGEGMFCGFTPEDTSSSGGVPGGIRLFFMKDDFFIDLDGEAKDEFMKAYLNQETEETG